MKIEHIRTRHFSVQSHLFAKADVTDTTHAVPSLEIITVHIVTDTGLEGMGYTYTTGHASLTVRKMIEEELIPVYLHQSPRDYDYLWHQAWWATHWAGRGGVSTLAMAAVDIAVWDLLAKSEKLPLYRYIGKHRDGIQAYGSMVNLSYSLEQVLEETEERMQSGFVGIKMKVGKPDVAEDVERLEAVRKLIGPKMMMMLDANMGWYLNEAIMREQAYRGLNLAWIEEPFIPEDIESHALFSQKSTVPIAAGENLYSRYQFNDYFSRRAIQICQVDVVRCGGITEWMKIARLAETYNIPLAPHFCVDLHVSLLCTVPNAYIAEYLPWFHPVQKDPVTTKDGILRPKEVHGHGVEFDWDLLQTMEVQER